MKRAISVYLLFLFCIAGYCQRTLKFTDVMLYCGDTNLTVSENWDSSDSEKLGIIYVTEKRFYELLGQRRSIDIDYWTWRNERFGNGVSGTYSYLREQNDGLSVSVFYNNEELALLLENNTDMHIFIDLSSLMLFYCDNADEGVKSVSPRGNTLRNKKFHRFDYVLIPPKKKAETSFHSLQNLSIFPASLPKGTIIQYDVFSYAFSTDPWDTIEDMIPEKGRNGKKLFEEKDGVYYFSLQNDFLTASSFGNKKAFGFESRYHCKLY